MEATAERVLAASMFLQCQPLCAHHLAATSASCADACLVLCCSVAHFCLQDWLGTDLKIRNILSHCAVPCYALLCCAVTCPCVCAVLLPVPACRTGLAQT
jgi:hypothetical protein